ncbi:MAG: transcriptional regulator [Paracoccaceae bacterium]|nr:MAG: transcriptional regulator [Paracoccaceae bacterium]
MEIVFATDHLARDKRYQAWRDAICNHYVTVDVRATRPEDYRGFIREGRFGDVVLSDILLSEQRIRRDRQHIARRDKDCHYLQLIHSGRINVIQAGSTHVSNAARGALFSAVEPYELECIGTVRAFYLEIPCARLAEYFPGGDAPVAAAVSATHGIGRITAEFCASLSAEAAGLNPDQRARLGRQLLDLVAATLRSPGDPAPAGQGALRRARLWAVQHWIEAHLHEPGLSLERIAAANGMSLRYLHLLFEACEMSVSEWILDRRLKRCFDAIQRGDGRTITQIAFDHGFNSSAHFSTAFRRRFGISPRELRGGREARRQRPVH